MDSEETPKRRGHYRVAVVVENLGWQVEDDKFIIDDGIRFESLKRGRIKALYKKACKENNFHSGDYDGVYCGIVIEEKFLDEISVYVHSPHSIISILCNVIPLAVTCPVTSYSLIWSKNNFRTSHIPLYEVHFDYELFETLGYTQDITDKIHNHIALIGVLP
jgi:hypothetical protein